MSPTRDGFDNGRMKKGTSMYQRILVPLDGSATALRALHEATRLAVEQRAELMLLHIVAGFPTVGEIASPYSLEDLAASHRKSA